jgi:hypothetical protein
MSVRFASTTPALICLATWLAAAPAAQPAQAPGAASARTWLGNESRIESHLKTAEVTRIEEIGTGVTKPRRAHLEPPEPVESLVWKVLPPSVRGGYWESYKSEIAAYELDKLLGLHMVPPAVERTIRGETGAAIMWLDGIQSVKQSGGVVPSGAAWSAAIRRMIMFDNLICNRDRNAGNILIGRPGELILIDHSRAFITDKGLPHKIERVDAELWDRMILLTPADLTRALGPWIDRKAFDAMIERRRRMIAAVDKLVAKKGRALVIIP